MALTRLVGEVAIHGGNELKVNGEKVVRRNGRYQYWRISEFETGPARLLNNAPRRTLSEDR